MSSVNKAIILGRLGADPEEHNGVATMSVATTSKWRDNQTNELKEHTEWHRVSAFNKTADIALQYLHKGSQVYIEGRIKTNKYTDKNGIVKYSTGIIASNIVFIGKKEHVQTQESQAQESQAQETNVVLNEDNAIPF